MIELPEGVQHLHSYLSVDEQRELVAEIRAVVAAAPLYVSRMPKTGQPMTVRMTNCGTLGWVSDKEEGYRYQPLHPVTGAPWPAMPERLLRLWNDVANYPHPPEACLVNFYDQDAKMGLHQDRNEKNFDAPVISISLGDKCRFRVGGSTRGGKTVSMVLESGDVIVLGGRSRLAFHGVDRIYPGTSMLLKNTGRINLTMRRVTML